VHRATDRQRPHLRRGDGDRDRALSLPDQVLRRHGAVGGDARPARYPPRSRADDRGRRDRQIPDPARTAPDSADRATAHGQRAFRHGSGRGGADRADSNDGDDPTGRRLARYLRRGRSGGRDRGLAGRVPRARLPPGAHGGRLRPHGRSDLRHEPSRSGRLRRRFPLPADRAGIAGRPEHAPRGAVADGSVPPEYRHQWRRAVRRGSGRQSANRRHGLPRDQSLHPLPDHHRRSGDRRDRQGAAADLRRFPSGQTRRPLRPEPHPRDDRHDPRRRPGRGAGGEGAGEV
ncbi:MAG: Flavodoxin reductases (ferredoxin-NADPH reductases) family 1, partial [uncultured Thermomicrobiales bacterium]